MRQDFDGTALTSFFCFAAGTLSTEAGLRLERGLVGSAARCSVSDTKGFFETLYVPKLICYCNTSST